MSESAIDDWMDCLNHHAELLKRSEFDLDDFKSEAAPIVNALREKRAADGKLVMSREQSDAWADANTGFVAAAQSAMKVLAMVAYAECVEELTGKKILPEAGETGS